MKATRIATFYDVEICKYPVGFDAIKNVVIDATTVAAQADGRYLLKSGTILSKISASQKVKAAPSSGLAEVDVVGVLAYTVEFFPDTTGGAPVDDQDKPAAAFFWNCIFDSSKLTNYTSNAANIKAALPSCDFQ